MFSSGHTHFSQKQIQHNETIKDNWLLLDTFSPLIVIKCISVEECQKLKLKGKIIDVDEQQAYIFQSHGVPSTISNESSYQLIICGKHPLFCRGRQHCVSEHQYGHV